MTPAEARQRLAAERYEQLLLRRPRPGTALERLHAFHASAGTLESHLAELTPDEADDSVAAGNRWLLVGLLKQRSHLLGEAAEALEQAESRLPDDAAASFQLGLVRQAQGDRAAATEAMQRAIQRQPPRAEALPIYLALGRLYYQQNQDQACQQLWAQLQQQFGDEPSVSRQVAKLMVDEDRFPAAIERYEQLAALASGQDAVEHRLTAARLKHRIDKSDEALIDLQQLLTEVRPGSWLYEQVRQQIEDIYLAGGGYEKLVAYYAEQHAQYPDDVDVALRLGQTQMRGKQFDAAAATLQKLLERTPQSLAVREALLESLRHTGDWAAVATQYEYLADHHPDHPDYFLQWGAALLRDPAAELQHRRQAAAAVWQRLAQLRSSEPVIQVQVAERLAEIEQFDAAERLLRLAVELAPEEPQYREYLGQFFHEQGQQEQAIATWNSLAAGPRRNRDSLLRLAEVLATFEYADASLDAFAQAATYDLTLSQRLDYCRRLTTAMRFDEALAQWELAASIAETDSEHQQIWQHRVDIARASDTLQELIQQTTQTVHSDAATPQDHLRLAMLLQADSRALQAIAVLSDGLQQAPRNVAMLELASELYEQTDQPARAIEVLSRLAEVDSRSRLSVLQQIASRHVDLGQWDEALDIGRQLAAEQPTNPSIWLSLAEICFQSHRDEAGYEALREAIRVAPRDGEARTRLAARLASDYRTDEAIELYWQQWENVEDLLDKIDVVAALAPLYDRQHRLDQLIEKLRSQSTGSAEEAVNIAFQIATAYELVGNPGAGMQTLEKLRIDRPRDTDLLHTLIRLASLSGDVDREIEFYQELFAIDPSEQTEQQFTDALIRAHRFADLIEFATHAAAADPLQRALRVIRSLALSKNAPAALRICEQILEADPDAHSVRLQLTALQMAQKDYPAVVQMAGQLRDAIPLDTDSDRSIKDETLALMVRIADMSTVETDEWLQLVAELPEVDAAESHHLALPLLIISQLRLKKADEIQDQVDVDQLKNSDDSIALWEAYFTTLIHYHIHPPASLSLRSTGHPEVFALICRLAQLGDQRARERALTVISHRRSLLSYEWKGEKNPQGWHLNDAQLQWLEQQLQQPLIGPFQGNPSELVVAVANEFRAAGRPQDMQRLIQPLLEPTAVEQIPDAIYVAIHAGQTEQVLPQLSKWQTWLRSVDADQNVDPGRELDGESLLRVAMQLSQLPLQEQNVEQRFEWIATVLAAGAAARRLEPQFQERWEQPLGRVSMGSSFSNSLRVSPLLGQSLSLAGMRLLLNLDVEITGRLKEMLVAVDPTVPADEQKLRIALASAEWLWGRDSDRHKSAEVLQLGIERFPDDAELRIAYAIQAERLQQHAAALAQLDAANPRDPTLMQLKYLIIVRLAGYLSDKDRGQEAAERLHSMPLDRKTKMIVTGQLKRLGLDEQANQFLAQTTPAAQKKKALLETARSLWDSGNKQAAAEAAYDVLQRGTAAEKQQAIALLQRLEALPTIVRELEQRSRDNPHSSSLIDRIAVLKAVMGRAGEVAQLRSKQQELLLAGRLNSGDAETEIHTALQLSAGRNFPAALEHFLNAFAIDAQAAEGHITAFIQAAQISRRCDQAFQRLSGCDLSTLSFDALRDLMDMDPAGIETPTAAGRAFMSSLLSNSSALQIGPLLRELSRPNRLGDQTYQDADAPLRRIFSDTQNYRPEAELWNQGQANSDGRFFGSVEPILEVLHANATLKNFVTSKCEETRSTADGFAVATALLALLEETSQPDLKALEALLGADEPPLSGAFAWQAAQVLEQRDDLPLAVVEALYRVAVRDPQLSEQQRSVAGGVGAKLFSLLSKHADRRAARRWLLEDFSLTLQAELTRQRRHSRLQALESRLIQLDYPLDAFRVRDAGVPPSLVPSPAPELGTAAFVDLLQSVLIPAASAPSPSLDLLPMRPQIGQAAWDTSLVAMTLKRLAAEPEHRAALEALGEALDRGQDNNATDQLTRDAVKALLAMARTEQQAEPFLRRIIENFPPIDQSTAEMLDLWTVASVAAASEHPENRRLGVSMLLQLADAAEHHQADELLVAIAERLFAAVDKTAATKAEALLTQLAARPQSDPLEPLQEAAERNQIALAAARHGRTQLAVETLGSALGLWRVHEDTTIHAATQQTHRDYTVVLQALEISQQLIANAPPGEQAAVQIMQLLAPPQESERLYLYVVPSLGRPAPVAESKVAVAAPPNLASVLSAAIAGQAERDAIEAIIAQRQSIDSVAANVLLSTLAIHFADAAQAEERIEQMLEAAGEQVPAANQIAASVESLEPWTKTIQAMRQTESVCRLADRLLIPLSMTSDNAAIQAKIDEGLLRTAAMLIADRGALQTAEPQVRVILETVAQRATGEHHSIANKLQAALQ